MAGTFTAVDLSQLPPPAVVETLDFETIFAAMLADLRARDSTFDALVESDPAYKILEVAAYRELLIRQRVNDAARGVMLAYAQKSDLDQIAANYNVERLLIAPADDEAIPPVAAIYEGDEELRRRVVLSQEAYTTAGSVGAYLFHALSADGDVLDVAVENPATIPGTVRLAVLSRTGSGTAPSETLAAVVAALSAETVRPLCDTVNVSSADVVEYTIDATLVFYSGVGQQQALDAALASAQAYVASMHRLGLDVVQSGVHAALHQAGIQKVTLTGWTDKVMAWSQAGYCTAINLTNGGTGD